MKMIVVCIHAVNITAWLLKSYVTLACILGLLLFCSQRFTKRSQL